MTTNAVCFDFNGTLSLDEELMYDVLAQLFAERGRPLPRAVYFEQFVGLGDDDALAFEDTPAGIASAKGAGLRCCGIATTVPRERLGDADVVADALTPELVESLL